MKKVGIILLLCWPLAIAWFGLHSFLAPKYYYATTLIENEGDTDEMTRAFREATQLSSDIEFSPVLNTDLYEVQVRDSNAQRATDRVNSLAQAIMKLPTRKNRLPQTLEKVEAAMPSPNYPLLPNILFGFAIGFVPGLIGLILILVERWNHTPPRARQTA